MKNIYQKRILIRKFKLSIALNVKKIVFELLKKKWSENELYRYETKLSAIEFKIKYFQKTFFGFKKNVISSQLFKKIQQSMIQKKKKIFFEICKRQFHKIKTIKDFISLWEHTLEKELFKKWEYFTKWKEFNRKFNKKQMIKVYKYNILKIKN